PWCSPPVIGGLTTDFAVLDHSRDEAWLVLDEAADDGRAPWKERRDQLLTLLAEGGRTAPVASAGELVRHVTAAEHIARIERARGWIAEGEFYQVNLAQHFTRATQGHPVDLYTRLRRANPGGYNAYVSWGPEPWPTGALLSTSPELLLAVDGRRATTRPIKGTTARSTDPVEDAAAVAALRASAKERAELAMIVDLERNDLGRVATPGSVTVGEFPEVESYRNLHHLVAEVSAELRSGLDGGDALEALFPGGSITGAPKVRAMEIIAELEPTARGPYCGSLGYIGFDGSMDLSILIRTITAGRGWWQMPVGGGIVAQSNPQQEYEETWHKATGMLKALR
ncbi:MAG: anthranilate synthase component I family protein, partial [Planctomycetota bacterium]|nr:anthranilate synthase component I family protein [Planctomycetota bacterium]